MKEDSYGIDIEIPIGKEKYHIGSDRYNFILGKKQYDKRFDNLSFSGNTQYFPTLEGLFVELHKLKVRKMEAKTLIQLQENIDIAKKEITDLYRTITKEEMLGYSDG